MKKCFTLLSALLLLASSGGDVFASSPNAAIDPERSYSALPAAAQTERWQMHSEAPDVAAKLPQSMPLRKSQLKSVSELAGDYVQAYEPMISSGIKSGGEATIRAIGTDSIAIDNFWVKVTPTLTVKAKVDIATGKVTIPTQYVFTDNTYGPLSIAVCALGGPDRSRQIEGYVDDAGSIHITTPWGIYGDEGTYKDHWVAIEHNTVFDRANGTMKYGVIASGAQGVMNYKVNITQPSANLIVVKNFFNSGLPCELVLNADRTASINRQEVMEMIYNNAVVKFYTAGNCEYNDAGKLTGASPNFLTEKADAANNRTIDWTNWTLLGSNNMFYANLPTATLTSSFDISYPSAPTGALKGSGTEQDPYQLSSLEDFIILSNSVNNDTTVNGGTAAAPLVRSYMGKHFAVTNDIDMRRYRFTPIGANTMHSFAGILDGRGHTISNLDINTRAAGLAALIGYADTVAVIKNLTLADATIGAEANVAAPLVGLSMGTVENCHSVRAVVSNSAQVAAGLVGLAKKITDCSVRDAKIYALGGYGAGIVGELNGEMTGSYASGIYMIGNATVAGLPMGGLAAYMRGKISKGYFSGHIDGKTNIQTFTLGGIVGQCPGGTIEECFSVGRIECQPSVTNVPTVGGIAGSFKGTMTNCHAAGYVDGANSDFSGGLIGNLLKVSDTEQSTVSNCFSSAVVLSKTYQYNADKGIRELFGTIEDKTSPVITNTYFDNQLTNFGSKKCGTYGYKLASAEGPAGFSSYVWTFTENQYPRLKAFAETPAAHLAATKFEIDTLSNIAKVQNPVTFRPLGETKFYILKDGKLTNRGDFAYIEGNTLRAIGNGIGADSLMVVNGSVSYPLTVKVAPACWEGKGTAEEPFLLRNKTDLINLSLATTEMEQYYPGTYFRFANDIDLEYDRAFIGICSDQTTAGALKKFQGIIDGNGHTLHRMDMNYMFWSKSPEESSDGLGTPDQNTCESYKTFVGRLGEQGVVKNLSIAADCIIRGWSQIGGVVGYNYGTIENCRNYADITAYSNCAGGITGQSIKGSVIRNCYNAGNVTSGFTQAGGIASTLYGLLENCVNTGNVTVRGMSAFKKPGSKDVKQAGGIVGQGSGGKILNVVNFGTVTAEVHHAGGIIASIKKATNGDYSNDMINAINVGMVNAELQTAIGAMASEGGTAGTVENNFYDAQIITPGAIANNMAAGVTAANTATLTSGKLPEGFSAEIWQADKDLYPVIKIFAEEPKVKMARAAVVSINGNYSAADFQGTASLAKVDGLTWKLAKGTEYSIAGTTLNAPKNVAEVTGDTLMASSGIYTKIIPLQTMTPCPLKGEGTAENPYQLTSADEWNSLAAWMEISGKDMNGTFIKVMNDIDFTDKTMKPLACNGVLNFNGTLLGNGKVFKGYTLGTTATYQAPIGILGVAGTIQDLTMAGTISSTFTQTGGFVGKHYGTLRNCSFAGTLTSNKADVGGFAARSFAGAVFDKCVNNGTVESSGTNVAGIAAYTEANATFIDCANKGTVRQKAKSNYNAGIVATALPSTFIRCENHRPIELTDSANTQYVAGIVAYANGAANEREYIFEDCVNHANIAGKAFVGSIVASAGTNVGGNKIFATRCVNYGDLTTLHTASVSNSALGGVISQATAGSRIIDCVNYGKITNRKSVYAGGIIGSFRSNPTAAVPAEIKGCVNYGEVAAEGNQGGGIIGLMPSYSTIDSCANHGPVNGTWNIGGIAGQVSANTLISRCYNTGAVTGSQYRVGGLTGSAFNLNTKITDCWNSGDVASTNTTADLKQNSGSQVGGLGGYSAAEYTRCYNTGSVKGVAQIGGLVGQPYKARTKFTACYNTGILEAPADTCGSIVGVATVGNGSYWNESNSATECYFLDRKAETDLLGTAMSEAQLAAKDMGEGWLFTDEFTFPLLAENCTDKARVDAARVILSEEDREKGIITGTFRLGCPEGLVWTASTPDVNIDGTEAIWKKAFNGDFAMTATCGEYTRKIDLKASVEAGIENGEIGAKAIKSVEFFTPDGLRVAEPQPGQICIRRTIFADGTSEVSRIIFR